MANGDYFAAHPEIVKIFDDLEAFRDFCRYEGFKFNEKFLYRRDSKEGGALNANYTTVEAVAKICNTLGVHGYHYGKDFIWEDQGYTDDLEDAIILNYKDDKIKTLIGVAK